MRAFPAAAVATALLGALLTAPYSPAPAAAKPASGPDTPPAVAGWPTTTPSRAGFLPRRLGRVAAQARQAQSSCLAVVRDGRLVRDWNWGARRGAARQTFSITKSVTNALVGIAVRDGSLDIDAPVATYVPAWAGTASADVTVRHLLTNTSGRFWSATSDYHDLTYAADRTRFAIELPQQHEPGTVWAYNNAAIQVLDRVLRSATGMPTDRFARERLFEPLGMSATFLTRDRSGRSTNVYVGLHSTCLDLARFAQLYLDEGVVDGRRIVSAAWVRRSTGWSATALNAAYGYLWWVNRYGVQRGALDAVDEAGQPVEVRRGRLVPAGPPRLYAAVGLGGQVAMVEPRTRTVVVRLGAASLNGYGLRDVARVATWASRR